MQILEGLARACDSVGALLRERLDELKAKTPLSIKETNLKTNTAAGMFLRSLSPNSGSVQLDALTSLTAREALRLRSLEADLAQDPKLAAARITNLEQRLTSAIDQLKSLLSQTSEVNFLMRDEFKANWLAKAEAARVAADGLFAASPLPEIGQAVWRDLWEAARKYSDMVAFPAKAFPASLSGEVCVLCQQPLDATAVQRFQTFESFVKGNARDGEKAAEAQYATLMDRAAAARVPMDTLRLVRALVRVEIGDADLSVSIRRCGVKAAWRLRSFCRERSAPIAQDELPLDRVATLSVELKKRAAQLAADRASPEYQALLHEFKELKDREALCLLKSDISAEIGRLKEAAKIELALNATVKRPITNKNKELSDSLITGALRGRFAREIEKLNLSRMPIELRKIKDQAAVSYFQVCLVEQPGRSVGEIFSEGEHRCVALAAFLAELVTSRRYSGIVFDDPMSSLDHMHRKSVAARLVEEAAHRQVIVFTHDLTFLFELRREAEAKVGTEIHYQTVTRRQGRPGYVDPELPMKAKSARQLANALRSELKAVKSEFASWNEARRTIFCKGIIEQLREAWDQGIADFIFPVLARFDNTIKGSTLYKLAVLSDRDVEVVTAARQRLSEEMHSSAEALNPETVSRDDLVAEVAKLEQWLTDITNRQSAAKQPATSFT
jgi:AAA domain